MMDRSKVTNFDYKHEADLAVNHLYIKTQNIDLHLQLKL